MWTKTLTGSHDCKAQEPCGFFPFGHAGPKCNGLKAPLHLWTLSECWPLSQVESHVLIFNPNPYGVGGSGKVTKLYWQDMAMWVPTLKTVGWRKTSSLMETVRALSRRRGRKCRAGRTVNFYILTPLHWKREIGGDCSLLLSLSHFYFCRWPIAKSWMGWA